MNELSTRSADLIRQILGISRQTDDSYAMFAIIYNIYWYRNITLSSDREETRFWKSKRNMMKHKIRNSSLVDYSYLTRNWIESGLKTYKCYTDCSSSVVLELHLFSLIGRKLHAEESDPSNWVTWIFGEPE